jgi:hypothetical protein
MQALKGYEKAIRLEHMSTPRMVNNLDLLCASQSKTTEAEDMYMRIVRGYEKAWGAKHTSTLDTINNLGILYEDQVKMAEAEEMFVRPPKECGKAVGKDHRRTQKVACSLRGLHARNGNVALLYTLIQSTDDSYQSRQKLANLDL